MAVTGDTNLKPNPDDVDRILFPPKPPKRRPKALPESEFQIDNWDELLIEISDGSGRIGFKKIFDGKPSFESAYTRHYSELGFGQKSIEFLHICATANKTGSFSYQNRRQKSRVDNALREHFNMGKTESIVRHPTKKQNYIPLFRIWHYDKDGNSTY